jgi:hypothetical protein
MALIALSVIRCIDYLAYGTIFSRAMFLPKKKGDVFFSARKAADERWGVVPRPVTRGVIGTKKSAPEQKSAPGGKKKCSREHLSRALLRSVLFLATINKRWPKPIITPHTYRRSSITTAVTALPPTRPRHHRQRRQPPPRQLLPDNNQRRGATDPPPASDTPSRHGMPPPRGGGKV